MENKLILIQLLMLYLANLLVLTIVEHFLHKIFVNDFLDIHLYDIANTNLYEEIIYI